MCYHNFKGKGRVGAATAISFRYRALRRENLWSTGLRRSAHGVVDQGLAQRPDRAGDLVDGGDHGIERGLDPVAILFGDGQRRQQFYRVAAVAGDLGENLVVLERWPGDELAEQTLVGG